MGEDSSMILVKGTGHSLSPMHHPEALHVLLPEHSLSKEHLLGPKALRPSSILQSKIAFSSS